MKTPSAIRVAILVLAVSSLATAVAARLVSLQVFESAELRNRATRQHRQLVKVDGRRGAILDRNGRELAASVTTHSLYAHPGRVEGPERVARLLSPVVGVPASELLRKLRSDEPFQWLARRLDARTARAVRDLPIPVGRGKPIDFHEEPKRFYPQGSLGIHAVGYANIDQQGIEGIEKRFHDVLQGDESHYLAIRDGRGGHLLQLVRPPTKRSRDVVLTLDLVLQHIAERALDDAMRETGAKAASAVLLEPATGQILAIANRPTYDPEGPSRGKPDNLRNRAVADLYEPGSTFKVVTAAIALDEGRVSPEQRFDCSPRTISGKLYQDVHRHGVLSFREILEKSSNVGILQIGRTISREVLRDRIVRFGFGRRTDVELPGERHGRITSLSRMSDLSTLSMSMGYEIEVTALQVAAAIAAVSNDGILVPPRVVLGLRHPDGSFEPSPAPEPRRAVSSRTAITMANVLEGVVARGTGTRSAVPGYRIAGKTGTSRKIQNGRYSTTEYMASFAGFGPVSSPRIAGVVVLDTPRGGTYYGGLTAAPVMGRILADGLAYLRVPADDDPWKARDEAVRAAAEARARRESKKREKPRAKETEEPEEPVATGAGLVPDVRGRPLREATALLVASGYGVRARGSGVVLEQTPPAGAPLAAGAAASLRLGPPPAPRDDRRGG